MTEPIAVDLPPKPVAGLPPKPTVAGVAPIPATPKPDAAKPVAVAKPPVPPMPPKPPLTGTPSFFQRLTRKQAAIGASALFSLAAGIAAVRLISPSDEPEPATASRPLVPDAKPGAKPPAIEEVKPGDTIPPAGLPIAPIPVAPAQSPPGSSAPDPLAPAAPLPPGTPPKVIAPIGSDPLLPAAPTGKPPAAGDMFTPIPKSKGMELEEPDLFGDKPIIPIAGAQPPKPDPMKTELPKPAVPPLPDIPGLPGTPKIDPMPKGDPPAIKLPDLPGALAPAKEPDKPIVGLSPLPMTGDPMPPMVPVAPPPSPKGGLMPPPELGPLPPAKLPTNPPDTGTRIDFTKPPGSPAVTPISATSDRAPTTSYDVDIYSPRAGDTWEAISREFYSDTRFAAGLRAYNRNRALAANASVDVPPIHVVKRYMPAAPATPPGTGSGGFGGGEWGAVTPPARPATDKPFRVPTGGMSMRAIARVTLGSEQRFDDIYRLNPHLKPDEILPAGTELQLPPNARNP